jgi:hypothetical protein
VSGFFRPPSRDLFKITTRLLVPSAHDDTAGVLAVGRIGRQHITAIIRICLGGVVGRQTRYIPLHQETPIEAAGTTENRPKELPCI